MAKINNQAVVQKLIDELKLYPGADVIPTEVADKILPTFQINDQEVNVTREAATVVDVGNKAGSGSAAVYAVPSTGKFYLTNCSFAINIEGASASSNYGGMKVTPKGGTAAYILFCRVYNAANSGNNEALSFNLQNPLLLEPGSNITVDSASAAGDAMGTIVGYTE